MNEPLRTTAGDGASAQEKVADIFRTELSPAQMSGDPAEEEATPGSETDLENGDTTDQLADESLNSDTEAEIGSETEETAEEEGAEIRDLTSLAEQIGVDLPYLYDLEMTLSDDGVPVKLGEIKDRLQEQGRLDTDRENLQTERSAFEQERAQHLSTASQASEELVKAEAQVAMLAQQYQSADWAAMEQEDAGKTALYKQELTTAYQNAQYQVQQVRQQHQSTQQQQVAAMRITEETELIKHVETWKDKEVRSREVAGITTLMADYGYAPQDIGNVMDNRAVRVMRDLYLLKQEKSAADKNVQKVRKVPKAIKPGGAPKRVDQKKKALHKSIQNAAESNDQRVKTRAIGDLLSQTGAL
jgi:hypothetical protein